MTKKPGAITPDQWALVTSMIAFDRNDRLCMDEVINSLSDLAENEEMEESFSK